MKRKIILMAIAMACLLSSNVHAQIPIEYVWIKMKQEFPPIAPLAPEKTFNVKLPDSLKYVLGRNEVRKYWGSYGLQLINKWDEKSPANYTFKFELDGLNVLQTEIEERASDRTATGKEFFRNYLFTFPSRIQVIDNSTKEVIRTITITSSEDTFIRSLHKYFFLTDSFDPNYGKVVGFDSLKTVKRIQESDAKVLREIEGKFANEVIFEKMKAALVALYGKQTFKGQFAAFNPKAKNRTADFSDFDAASQRLIKAYETLKLNWNDENARKAIQEVEDFYAPLSQNQESRFLDYVPMMINFNLAEINLVQGDFEKAQIYYTKSLNNEKPDAYFDMFCKPGYEEAKQFLEVRNMVVQNKVFASHQKATLTSVVQEKPEELPLTTGYIVTASRDTVRGKFKDFEKASYDKSVRFIDKQGNEKVYEWKNLKFASSNGVVYESMAGSMVVVVYYSPAIQVYQLRQTGEYIYNFPKTGAFGKYKPFSRDDASNYLSNYNKQLAEVFKGCADVVKKIEAGTYELKSEKANGHILVIADYEAMCGSGNFEKTMNRFKPDAVRASYK